MLKLWLFFLMSLIVAIIAFFPIFTIIHCLNSKERSNKSKTIWVLVMIFLWSLGGLLYGLFAFKNRILKWFSGLALLIVIIAVFYTMNWTAKEGMAQVRIISSKLSAANTFSITETELAGLRENIRILETESTMRRFGEDKIYKAIFLLKFLGYLIEDKVLTRDEYNNWTDKFQSRAMFDKDGLKDYIIKEQQKGVIYK